MAADYAGVNFRRSSEQSYKNVGKSRLASGKAEWVMELRLNIGRIISWVEVKPWLVKSVLIKTKVGIPFWGLWLNMCSEVPTNHLVDSDAGMSMRSPVALDVARRWLQLYDTSHSNCKQWLCPSGDVLPSRLLAVRVGTEEYLRLLATWIAAISEASHDRVDCVR